MSEVSTRDDASLSWWNSLHLPDRDTWCRQWLERLYPLLRTSVGSSVADTLRVLQESIPLKVEGVPTGTRIGDWTVPAEWDVGRAYVEDEDGTLVIDSADCNLHVVNGSEPVDRWLTFEELLPHLHVDSRHPQAIPYRTSYYHSAWGFCCSQSRLNQLAQAGSSRRYHAVIESERKPGLLRWGEYSIAGESEAEVIFSAHLCHPSLANDNLSGMLVAVLLARYLASRPRRVSYRFLWGPGTIGPIAWWHSHGEPRRPCLGGAVLAMLGDDSPLNFKRSLAGRTPFEQSLRSSAERSGTEVQWRDFTPEGYDERQFNSVGINLPLGRLSRADWTTWPAYHCSLDNLDCVETRSIRDAFLLLATTCDQLESLTCPMADWGPGEPQLGRHGLWNSPRSDWTDSDWRRAIGWIATLADGRMLIEEMSAVSHCEVSLLVAAVDAMTARGLLQNHRLIDSTGTPGNPLPRPPRACGER